MTEVDKRSAVQSADLLDALDRVIGHDPTVPGLSYDTVAQLLSSAANAAKELRAALSQDAAQASPDPVQDTYLVGGPDLKAMSGSVESDRVIQLHFRRKATDADRKWLLEAINAKIAAELPHELYKTGDKDAPDPIKDRNGEVVLGLCRRCGKGEIELSEPCTASSVPSASCRPAAPEPTPWPTKGDWMIFLGKNGYPFELEAAMKLFTIGQALLVEDCNVESWSHSVKFVGIPGRFNGVMFKRTSEVPSTHRGSPEC